MTKKMENEERVAVIEEQQSKEPQEVTADGVAIEVVSLPPDVPEGQSAGNEIEGNEEQSDKPLLADASKENVVAAGETGVEATDPEELEKEPLQEENVPAANDAAGSVVDPAKNGNSGYAFVLAAQAGHLEEVKAFLETDLNVNAVAAGPVTALELAAQNGHTEVVRSLISAGAYVNVRGIERWTPLMKAAMRGHSEIAQLLVTSGADYNATNKNGDTALILATRGGHAQVAQVLLASGARSNIQNRRGKTALYYAVQAKNDEIAEMIRKAARQ